MIEKNVCSMDCNEEKWLQNLSNIMSMALTLHKKLTLLKQLQQFCSTYSTQAFLIKKITVESAGKCGDTSRT